jgi:cytochrome c biogenesis protein CcdA
MRAVLRLIGIVVSIGLADSLNPTTIVPALYFATGDRARGRVFEFTLAVFAVYLLGGLAIAFGPGQLILSLASRPDEDVRHAIETAVGVAILVAAAWVWFHRRRLVAHEVPDFDPRGRSSAVLGATITAVELPTAFPYFAAIAAVVGSGVGLTRQLFLIALFNLCFVLPLLGIAAILTFAGPRADRMLAVSRGFLERHWPALLAGLGLLAGLFVVFLGVSGLLAENHSHFGRFIRGLRHAIHP